MAQELGYLSGFGNEFATEAVQGTLPEGQNAPQKVAHGLYAEQLSGTAFTAPRAKNRRSWLYRIRPSVLQSSFQPWEGNALWLNPPLEDMSPNQFRWNPISTPLDKRNFIEGIVTLSACGDGNYGCSANLYACNKSMEKEFFYSADSELLILPYEGPITINSEMGTLDAAVGDVVVIPRGIKFQIKILGPVAKGYVCENFGSPFIIPDLGPIGSNGLANPRDFLYPVAKFEDTQGGFELITKFNGKFWTCSLDHSPLDVVGWHGNYAPYKYDLNKFNTMGSISFDHPDPSIFTVLTSPSLEPGTANCDFVIFPPRWMVGENTFRPPYYHRNLMSEFMGLLWGEYDAKGGGKDGFLPGGSSLHNCMSAHGPETAAFESASEAILKPEKIEKTMAFMFESRYPFGISLFARKGGLMQENYMDCWKNLKKNFRI